MASEQHEPTLGKIVSETWSSFAKTRTAQFLGGFVKGLPIPYYLPTAIRQLPWQKGWNNNTSESEIPQGIVWGLFLSELATLGACIKYPEVAGIPTYLIPLAANATSAIYESGRMLYHASQNAKQRLIARDV